MWSRVVEIMLGCWLLISPFVFDLARDEPAGWINDFASGSAVVVFGFLSYWDKTRYAHLATIAVGMWLLAFAYWHAAEAPSPALQNDAIVGLLLLMFAVIPNEASEPPESWAMRHSAQD